MNIREYINYMKSVRGDRSFAFLAERCETSEKNPFRIRPAEPIKADEVLVCMLCGANRDNEDHIREYNGYLKQVDEFVKKSPKLKDKKVRVCVAVCNFGKYHDTDMARHLQYMRYANNKEYEEIVSCMSPEVKEEILTPCYIQDIFDATILPRISSNTTHQSLNDVLKNIRRLNFVTPCHGADEAIELEDKIYKTTKKMGYTDDEQKQIFAQQMILNFNPEGAKSHARSCFITIQSAADTHNHYTNFMEEYLLMRPSDFGFIHLNSKNVNILMCAQVDKRGIEGNPPPVYVVRPIEEVMREAMEARKNIARDEVKDPEEEKYATEHSFMGFSPKANMSKGALKIQKIAGNILENAVVNSVSQTSDNFIPLPSFLSLAANDRAERFEIAKANLKGWKISLKMIPVSMNKIASYNAYRREHTIEI